MVLANKNRFGRSSEKMEIENQIRFMEVDGTIVLFNEIEAVCNLDAVESEDLEPKPVRKPKPVDKKADDMAGLPINVIHHYLSEEKLITEFGENGWNNFQLPFQGAII